MPRHLGCLLALALLMSSNPVAQQNATVQGAVVDEQRGALPGATVTATDVSTGRQSVVVTTEEGRTGQPFACNWSAPTPTCRQ